MVEPVTSNIGLIVPNTGDLVGTWGSAAINPDMVALDGLFGGYQAVAVSNANVLLTSPSGFTPTPSGGPTQSQNLVLSFTGAMTVALSVTLPIPGSYIIENRTTGNFVLFIKAVGTGEIIAVDQGDTVRVYNDGTNVRFVNFGRVGHTEIWAGLSAMPSWVTACTIPPFLLCDGTVYNFSTYPYLGKRLLGAFGGNGTTTFGVPDLRGRVPLAYDGTGTRITTAGAGLNGQTLGATLDQQTINIIQSGLPNVAPTFAGSAGIATSRGQYDIASGSIGGNPSTAAPVRLAGAGSSNVISDFTPAGTISSINGNVTQTGTPNIQPSQVTGIAVIRAA